MSERSSESFLLRVHAMLTDLSPERAVSAATRLLAHDPSSDAAHFALGVAARRAGRQEVAIGALRNAGRLNRDSALIARVLGETFLHSEEPRLASIAFMAALDRAPEDVEAAVGLAVCHATVGQADDARALLVRVLEQRPDHAVAALYMGLILVTEGNPREALHWFRVSTAADPRSPAAWVHLGQALQCTGDTPGAEAAFQAALALVPHHRAAKEALAALPARQS